MRALRAIAWALAGVIALWRPVIGQVSTNAPEVVPGARPVTLERIKIPGKALEGNLEGNVVDREAIVVRPPGYQAERTRRYPVVYALHGYSIGAEQWIRELHVPQTIESALAKGARPMIVVFPDSKTVHNGSMYSNSITTGYFEDDIWRDVVNYIDERYRTIPDRSNRGLVGHSMGGYGASRIGMKHPDVFGSLYIMSPCCMSPRGAGPSNPASEEALAAVKTPGDSAKLPFGLRTQLAVAAAWSPNPNNPPLYFDLPVGPNQQAVLAKWAANAPLAFIDQYIENLRRYRALAIDVGDKDNLKTDTNRLDEILDTYKVMHAFEIYPGTHTSHVAFRFQDHVMPFFSTSLSFAPPRRLKSAWWKRTCALEHEEDESSDSGRCADRRGLFGLEQRTGMGAAQPAGDRRVQDHLASAATLQVGNEAAIFKAVLWHSIVLASLVGLIVMSYAYLSRG